MNFLRSILLRQNGFSHRLCQHQFNFFHNSSIWSKLVQFKLSDIGEGIAEVQLKEWHVKVGDLVNEFDEICAVQSDKAAVTITSRYSGTIKKLYFKPDDIAKVGQPLVDIELANKLDEETTEAVADSEPNNVKSQNVVTISGVETKVLASPAVRRLIREYKLDSAHIHGTGPNGRVLKEDLLNLIQTNDTKKAAQKTEDISSLSSSSSSSSSDDDLGEKRMPIRGHTRAMLKAMSEALAIPHFGYGDEIVADELIKARKRLAPIAEQRGIKLSYMPFLIKAASLALNEFPILNSSLDKDGQYLIYKHSHNISLAMDTPDGLAVPNVKNCQQKSILQIAAELATLMECGRAARLGKEQLSGGTFTISNIGSIGGTFMSPVILPPQVAIGAVGKIRKTLRLNKEMAGKDQLDEQSVMNVFWAADHRVIDGATLARFSNRFKNLLENPVLMLAELR